jgi:protoporphyrinogen oxidase
VPTEVYLRLVGGDRTAELERMRYSALISMVCATRQPVHPRAYWINLASLDRTACGIFLLSELNPTIGGPGETCVNFVTHLRGRDRPLYRATDDELLARYRDDFRAVFGAELEATWTHLSRVPMYSPVFGRSYHNPPARSASWENMYFAGNYRTFPSIVSTGTALGSGLETGAAMLRDLGIRTTLAADAAEFRLRGMPRG